MVIMMTGTELVVAGAIVGGITLNPIILGSISGCDVMVQALAKVKSYDKKSENSPFAYATFRKLLVSIREHMRIENLDDEVELLKKMTILDKIVIDFSHTPIVDNFKKKYLKTSRTTSDSL